MVAFIKQYFNKGRPWRKKILLAIPVAFALLLVFPAFCSTAHVPTLINTSKNGPSSIVSTSVFSGGWDLKWGKVPNARWYQVYIDGGKYATLDAVDQSIHIDAGIVPESASSPYPLFAVRAVYESGDLSTFSFKAGCTPLTYVAVRGSGQNDNDHGYAGSLGDRGASMVSSLRKNLGTGASEVSAVGLAYPAARVDTALGWLSYSKSVSAGVLTLGSTLPELLSVCPQTNFILFGYSQGADVIASTWQSSLPEQIRDHVLHITLFGDPHYNPNDTSNQNSSAAYAGPLGARVALNEGKIRSWCATSDVVCQGSNDNLTNLTDRIHGQTYDTWQEEDSAKTAAQIRKKYPTGLTLPPKF